MNMIVGIDAGNYQVKVVGPYGEASFLSNICDHYERKVTEQGADDMVWEYEGRKGFAGTLAAREDEFGGVMYGDSKAHEDAKIRILLGLHRYCNDGDNIRLVTGQPIIKHTDEEKAKIQSMLKGSHDLKVNGITKTLFIDDVRIAPEGSAAYWINPKSGAVKILDVGSGTVNVASIRSKMHINNESNTLGFGMETLNNANVEQMALGIVRNLTKKWTMNDEVLVCGGMAEEIQPHIQRHFTNAKVLRPIYRYNGGIKQLHPVYANACGFYEIAKGIYGQ